MFINLLDIILRYFTAFFYVLQFSDIYLICYLLFWVPIVHDIMNGWTILYLFYAFSHKSESLSLRQTLVKSYYTILKMLGKKPRKRVDLLVFEGDSRKILLTDSITI